MKEKKFFFGLFISSILLLSISACSTQNKRITLNDVDGVYGKTGSPVAIKIKLNARLQKAAAENRLAISDPSNAVSLIPLQADKLNGQMVGFMPDGTPGNQTFEVVEMDFSEISRMEAGIDTLSSQIIISEGKNRVLQYNHNTVHEKDVIRSPQEKAEEYTRTERDTFVTTSIYAVPRSDYIHPLYGLEGEMLTRDWPADGSHPHHRGIFWSWPEVEVGTNRGDIYALQKIFARPSGKPELISGPVFAQIAAENLWMWEDVRPIVHENVIIRVYRANLEARIIELSVQLDALEDSITIATRGTDSYGGLNIRMQTPESQEISYFTDDAGSEPLRAWSDFTGKFDGNESPSGLMVLQHKDNPEYPGSWVEYPDLAWVQPTFPTKGTRYSLQKGNSLFLRYRFILHTGGKSGREISEKRWDAFNGILTPLGQFHN